MVAVTVTYAVALAVLRPSNTPMDAAVTAVNAGMGAAVAIVVLLQGPGVGAQLAFAQGIFAVCTAVFPALAMVLSGRARRRLVGLCVSDSPPDSSSDCSSNDVSGRVMSAVCFGVSPTLDTTFLDDLGIGDGAVGALSDIDAPDTFDARDSDLVHLQETDRAVNSMVVSVGRRECVVAPWAARDAGDASEEGTTHPVEALVGVIGTPSVVPEAA
jgi:hypothetical protein